MKVRLNGLKWDTVDFKCAVSSSTRDQGLCQIWILTFQFMPWQIVFSGI